MPNTLVPYNLRSAGSIVTLCRSSPLTDDDVYSATVLERGRWEVRACAALGADVLWAHTC